ncbi:MAG: BREX-1 system adenine-specific DNA-methyltransferase PglX [Cyanobacteria bacterium J06560_6]
MNRNAIKTFAVWARRELREQVTARLKQFGITTKEIVEPQEVSGGLIVAGQTLDAEDAESYRMLRRHLPELLGGKGSAEGKALKAAVESLIDEIAYTWFNRFSALRYMEVNGYLRRRVLSSSDPELVDPDILRDASDIAALGDLPGLTLAVLDEWRSLAAKAANPDEFLYRRLVNAQCLALASGFPFLFEVGQQYTALFMPGNLLNSASIVRRLVADIPEEDWRDSADSENGVEIIGWLYQFYISERKDEVIGAKGKIAARDIPAATQLFTPHWIVRYMVENSLGRLWMEGHPESKLKEKMPYYLENPPEEQAEEGGQQAAVDKQLELSSPVVASDGLSVVEVQDLTVMDPACGSGHILVYAFDLLFEIYKEQGYAERDIPELILEHNLHGLDIDERAVQLASFSVLMKARAKNPRILRRSPSLNIAMVRSTQNLNLPVGAELGEADWRPLTEAFKEADSLGSLITPPALDEEKLLTQVDAFEAERPIFEAEAKSFRDLIKQSQLLKRQYSVVVANPPYMGGKGMNAVLKDFAKKYYSDCKADLFAVSVARILEMTSRKGRIGLMTPFTWMFLSSYEKLRNKLLDNTTVTSLIRPEYHAFFDSAFVPICSFTLRKEAQPEYKGTFIDLSEFYGADLQSVKTLEAIENPDCGYLYYAKSADFRKIPGSAIAYWLSKTILKTFENNASLSELFDPKQGLVTANNDQFLRLWSEVGEDRIGFCLTNRSAAEKSKKNWFPYNKGGEFRKWYGNQDFVVNWARDGYEIRMFGAKYGGKPKSRAQNTNQYFQEGITWTAISSSTFSCRRQPKGFIFSNAGMTIYGDARKLFLVESLLNSHVGQYFLTIFGPTLNYGVGEVSKVPVITEGEKHEKIIEVIEMLEGISKKDWDNFEGSWNFQTHPFFYCTGTLISQAFSFWKQQSETVFQKLKQLEEDNNRYWINAYGLQSELTPEVPDEQITIRRADLSRDIRSFISYAVGCMMGRYSLDAPGLIHAGQPFDPTRHTTFPADADAIIPITDQAYFDDDIVTRFIEFVEVTYGKATLTENLDFIANALKLRASETAQDRIRRYFVTEFISDHIKTYKKRPIYWLFTSGKKRAFGALVYLHRYSEDTVARIRTDYVLELQVKLDKEIERIQADTEAATTTTTKRAATKRLKTLKDQQLELRDYQAKLQTTADQRIQLNLDDGVAYNYTLFQGLVYEGSDLKMKDLLKKSQWKRDLLAAQKKP